MPEWRKKMFGTKYITQNVIKTRVAKINVTKHVTQNMSRLGAGVAKINVTKKISQILSTKNVIKTGTNFNHDDNLKIIQKHVECVAIIHTFPTHMVSIKLDIYSLIILYFYTANYLVTNREKT